MKSSTRRNFLRATTLTATGLALVPKNSGANKQGVRKAIACAAPSTFAVFGTVASVQSGKWSDASTWGGNVPSKNDTPLISSGHTVVYDVKSAEFAGVNVAPGATLEFDSNASSHLASSRNISVQGVLKMKPSSADVVQRIQFVGIDENRVVGGGMEILETDIGLWVMGPGKLDLAGTKKTSWTRTTGSANAGTLSITVADAAGWRVGDEIMIVPTDMPNGIFDYNDSTQKVVDPFQAKFERRKIIAINGNSIVVDSALQHNHLQVSTDSGKTWNAEVANLTRNVCIEGTEKGRAHIFIRSSVPQSVLYVAGRYFGPRKMQGARRSTLITGRYALHFHHCQDGSRGSIVDGCAFYDNGNRVYVPHMSHGVSMTNNVSFNTMESAFWWDFQEITHDTNWDHNLIALCSWNGVDGSSMGMMLNMGDGNRATNNVMVYGHTGDEHNHGGYVWEANSEGVWVFEGNMSHSNRCGLFVWQNTGNNHTIVNQDSYNDYLGVFHGAYINSYTYTGGYFYNSMIQVKATSGNSSGVRFEKMTFDGARTLPHVVDVYPSPVTSGIDFNTFRDCTFKNYTKAALLMNTFQVADENAKKNVGLIKCEFSGKVGEYSRESIYDSRFYIQPTSGQCTMITPSGTSNIAAFAPYIYGTGRGLKGEYFNGSNFDSLAFTRNDSMIMFQQWTYDIGISPTHVHYSINNKDRYSVRWTGKVEAQYTEDYVFTVMGSGGFRLWVDGKQIINSWQDRPDNATPLNAPAMALVAGQKYDIKLETMNMDGQRACQLYWECKSIGRRIHIPQSQLYSDGFVSAPPPAQNQSPVANAGADISITLPVDKVTLDGSASKDPDGEITSYKWSMVSGPTNFTIGSTTAVKTEVTGLVEGTYVFRLVVVDNKGAQHQDDVSVIVKSVNKAPVANAGPDVIITLPITTATVDGSASKDADGEIKTYKWTKVDGPAQFKISKDDQATTEITGLVEGIYKFKLTVTDNKGDKHEDEVQVTVNKALPGNQSPVANAGAEINVTLPINSVKLDGSASKDPDGKIVSYKWEMVNGPAKFTIQTAAAAITDVIGLVEGSYTFRLMVTDDKNAVHTDDVKVTVHPLIPKNQSPVAQAGADIVITLPINTVTLDGSGSHDPDGKIASYKWTKINGPDQLELVSADKAVTKVNNLAVGVYTFRLQVVDAEGAKHEDDIIVTVKPVSGVANKPPVASAGADIKVQLPVNRTTLDGTGSYDPDGSIVAFKWTKVSGPNGNTYANDSYVTTEIADLVEGVYVFRLQVTDNNGAQAEDTVTVTVLKALPAAGNKKPIANAGDDIIITLPVNYTVLDGSRSLDEDGSIVSYRWKYVSGPTSYNVYRHDVTTKLGDLVAGVYVFRLVVIDNSGNISEDDVTVTVLNSAPDPNKGPVANAGADVTITLPVNNATLDGSASYDPDGKLVMYRWSKVAGPAQFTIVSGDAAKTAITNLAAGTYVFRLLVMDDKGVTAQDDVVIDVKEEQVVNRPAPGPKPPIADAGADVTVTLPTNKVTLNGSNSSDPDGQIVSYAWKKVSGPNNFNFMSTGKAITEVQQLTAGTYVFQLTVTDNSGLTATDEVTVVVSNSLARTETPTSLKAGVWPNPSKDVFNVNLVSNSDMPITVRVHNYWGKDVLEIKDLKSNDTKQIGERLGKGTYYLIAEQGKQKKIIKIIKM